VPFGHLQIDQFIRISDNTIMVFKIAQFALCGKNRSDGSGQQYLSCQKRKTLIDRKQNRMGCYLFRPEHIRLAFLAVSKKIISPEKQFV